MPTPDNSAHTFEGFLASRRDALLKRWFERIVSTYPQDSSKLFRKKDQFQNPVGHTFWTEISFIFDQLLLEQSTEELAGHVGAIVRIRAIQEYTASGAVAIFFLVKDVVRSELGGEVRNAGWAPDLQAFEDKVDQLCLLAFDLYMQSREKVWEYKAKEVQNRVKTLLRRHKLVCDFWEEGAEELKPLGEVNTPKQGQ